MSNSRNGNISFTWIFGAVIALTLAIWALRGIGILTFISSGVIWVLILFCIITGILSYLQNSRW